MNTIDRIMFVALAAFAQGQAISVTMVGGALVSGLVWTFAAGVYSGASEHYADSVKNSNGGE